MEAIGKTLLGFEDLHMMALDESSRDQCFFDRLSILDQLADVLASEGKYLLEFGSDIFWYYY
jgi:hypothetical protein